MKKLVISAALITLVSVAGWSVDKGRDQVKGVANATVQSTSRNAVYNLIYKSGQAGLVKVTISDVKGNVLLVDEIKSDGSFLRPYNFLGLAEGTYTVTVSDEAGKTTLPVEYRNLQALAKPSVTVKPLEENRYELTVKGTNDEVRVNIYDNNNGLLFTDEINQKGSFTRVYNLKSNLSNVAFEVVSNDNVIRTEKF